MKMTSHAKIRQKQRGMSCMILNVIEQNGRYKKAVGGAIKIYLGNREYQNIIHEIKSFLQILDKARGGTLIINEDRIVSVYKS